MCHVTSVVNNNLDKDLGPRFGVLASYFSLANDILLSCLIFSCYKLWILLPIFFCGGGLVAKLCLTVEIPWTIAGQALLSTGFSRQEYWSGLPFPTPGDLTNPGIKPMSLVFPALAGGFFTNCATWQAFHFD